ncbi:MAG: winged helix-turn-helix domain-containing protein [Chloroflexota bacterium]
MIELHQEHHPNFRQEIIKPLFQLISSGESSVVAGIAGLGKTRLLQFLMRAETVHHQLGEDTDSTLLVWADCNRMAELSPWGLYELLLTSIFESASERETLRPYCERLLPLRRETIMERSHLLAQRNLELVLRMFCQECGVTVAFILDEFDESYRGLPSQALANLRGLRDGNKYRLCYVLFMRDHPAHLRDPYDCEGFYELLSRSVLYLGPYESEDAHEAIRLICTRRSFDLSDFGPTAGSEIIKLSGGHPSIMVGMLDALAEPANEPPSTTLWLEWFAAHQKVEEECRKIWEGLRIQDQRTLHQVALATPLSLKEKASLVQKKLITGEVATEPQFVMPVFKAYVLSKAKIAEVGLRIDLESGIVWINGHASEELTGKEFELVELMGSQINQLCSGEEIISRLWPGDQGFEINPNTVAALVRRVRRKIEPNPSRPQYLVSIKGRGYRLLEQPESGKN